MESLEDEPKEFGPVPTMEEFRAFRQDLIDRGLLVIRKGSLWTAKDIKFPSIAMMAAVMCGRPVNADAITVACKCCGEIMKFK